MRKLDQPDHEGLIPASNREQARTKICNQEMRIYMKSFIEKLGFRLCVVQEVGMTLVSMAKLQQLAKLLTKRNPSLNDALRAVYMGE